MHWLIVVLAGLFEIAWAQSLKAADGFSRLWPSVIAVGITFAVVYTLAAAMRHLPTGTVYVVFTAMGAVGTALLGVLMHGESVTPLRVAGLSTILVGVVLLYMGDSVAGT
jgi:quaternary ammonium compound-resistance protein SugE